jgi:hypothetical protein
MLNVVSPDIAPVVRVPDVALLPDQPPDAVHDVAPELAQLSCADFPTSTHAGVTVTDAVTCAGGIAGDCEGGVAGDCAGGATGTAATTATLAVA